MYLFKSWIFSLGKFLKVELLDEMVFLSLVFWGTFILLSTVAAPFTFPPTTYKHSLFFSSSSTLVISCLVAIVESICVSLSWTAGWDEKGDSSLHHV